jgi:translation initiation factor IF-2
VLRSNELTEAQFLTLIRGDLLRQQLLGGVRSGAAAPDALTAPLLVWQTERRVADVVLLPFSAAPEPEAPTEAQLQRFLENNPQRFSTPEFRQISLAVLSAETLANEIAVSEEDIKQAFEARHGQFDRPERRQIRQVVLADEARAREISEFRQRKLRDKAAAIAGAGRGSLTDMLARIQAGEQKEVTVVVKADVQGSSEAIGVTLGKLGNEEVRVRVLHSAVGQITESDIQLAKASDAVIVAFNVRATSQARELATREGVGIRYYSIIYEVADDIEKLVKGKLAPVQREKFLGYAQILQVFEVKRIGKVAGCRITEGQVKRGAGVRLLRDGVVIHQGELSTLRRFKDDVREVGNGLECGMSFANYDDILVSDQIECYETETVAG